jgi:hypothetical protein
VFFMLAIIVFWIHFRQVVKCYSVQFHFSGQSKEICLAVNHVLQVMGVEQVLIGSNE